MSAKTDRQNTALAGVYRVAMETGGALVHAHRHGVIYRDIKSEDTNNSVGYWPTTKTNSAG